MAQSGRRSGKAARERNPPLLRSGLKRPFPARHPCLRRQASWPTALRRCDDRRTAATPAIPPKPISIIAQVAGSGVASGFTEDSESTSRTSANHAVGVESPVKDESRISIGSPAARPAAQSTTELKILKTFIRMIPHTPKLGTSAKANVVPVVDPLFDMFPPGQSARRTGRRGVVILREPEPASAVDLTRDLDVLALVAQGASNKTIPPSLWISVHTMKFHMASLLDKRCCRPIDPSGLSLEGGGEP